MRIKALQACIIRRHEISIQYKCKEYLTDIQRLIRANKIMKRNNLQAISRKNKIYFPNLLSYMYNSIYKTLIEFKPFTLMKVLFLHKLREITQLKNYKILNTVVLTLS